MYIELCRKADMGAIKCSQATGNNQEKRDKNRAETADIITQFPAI